MSRPHDAAARRRSRLTLAVVAAAWAWQMLVPPIIGSTDIGDFHRNLKVAGLGYGSACGQEAAGDAFCRELEILPAVPGQPAPWQRGLWNLSGREEDDVYYSSEIVLLWMARALNALLAKKPVFDVVCAGLVHAALLFLGLALLLQAAASALAPRLHLALCVSCAFVFTDVTYVAWFNSFYGEPGSLGSFLLVLGLGLRLTAAQSAAGTAAYFLAAALFATAKAQNVALALPLGLLGYRLGRGTAARTSAAGLGVLLLVSVLVFAATPPRILRRTGLYQSVFNGLLLSSPDPRADLRAFSLPEDFVRYVAVDYWVDPRTPRGDPAFDRVFFPRVSLARLAWHYATHPDRAWRVLREGCAHLFVARLPYLGHFDTAARQPPRAHSQAFTQWTVVRERLPANVWTLLLLLGGAVAAAAWLRRRARDELGRRRAEVLLLLPAVAALQVATVLVAEGSWNAKRQFALLNMALDLTLVGGALLLLARPARRGQAEP